MKTGTKHPKNKSNLYRLRQLKGFTQQKMADELGIDIKTYRQYEKSENLSEIRCNILITMADYFNVSTDYILGRSDCTGVTNDYISKITGLNDESIKYLARQHKFEYDVTHDVYLDENFEKVEKTGGKPMYKMFADKLHCSVIDMINFLLSPKYSMLTEMLMKGLYDFLHSKYRYPVYHTGEYEIVDGIQRPKVIRPTNDYDNIKGGMLGFPSIPLITLASSENDLHDNIHLPIDENFLQAVALQQITSTLQDMKDYYEGK